MSNRRLSTLVAPLAFVAFLSWLGLILLPRSSLGLFGRLPIAAGLLGLSVPLGRTFSPLDIGAGIPSGIFASIFDSWSRPSFAASRRGGSRRALAGTAIRSRRACGHDIASAKDARLSRSGNCGPSVI